MLVGQSRGSTPIQIWCSEFVVFQRIKKQIRLVSDTLNVRDPTIIDTASGYITQVRKYSFTLGFIAMVLAILIFAIMVRMWSSLANRNKLRDQNLYFIIGLNTLVSTTCICVSLSLNLIG